MAYAKSIVALVVGMILMLLNQAGITDQMPVVDAVNVIVTAIAVYFIPNNKKIEN